MSRHEYENTLRDLLDAPWLQIAERIPEDRIEFGFNRSAGALDVSHIQLSRFLAAADYALREASSYYLRGAKPTRTRHYARDQLRFLKTMDLGGPAMRHPFPLLDGKADDRFPDLLQELNTRVKRRGRHKTLLETQSTVEQREQEAIGVVVSTYEPTEIRFNNFVAPAAGKYRIRLRAYSIWVAGNTVWVEPDPKWGLTERSKRTLPDFADIRSGRRNEPIVLYGDTSPRILRRIGAFDVTPEPTTYEIDAWLLAGETIRPDAARLFRCRGAYPSNPLAVENDGMPGVAFQWLEVEGPLPAEAPSRVDWSTLNDDGADVSATIERFLTHAYRQPPGDADVARFAGVADSLRGDGESMADSLLGAYQAVFCSPEFLYLHADPGPLDQFALAARLSYFLINSTPSQELRALALDGALADPTVLREQTNRLLDSPEAKRFISALLDYWLDLRKISATSPDGSLYPEYQLDDLLVESMVDETRAYFHETIRKNLPIRSLVASNFAMLNERLADHYGVPAVKGVGFQRVALPFDGVRGGLMTQAAILKVTAGGTTTSPVLRGVWIAERLLGVRIPPPPESVPAVDPDTRGATSIREILDRHRQDESCASCHRRIDPYGFALEAFDVMGALRTHYRAVGGAPLPGAGHNGLEFEYHHALPVETDGVLPSGEAFADIRGLKELLVEHDRQLARNLLERLVVYATGAPVSFSDRPELSEMLDRTSLTGYRIRDLIHEVVQSKIFSYQ